MPLILLVEDEVAIADTLQFALGSDGFDVRRVSLAREALDLLRVTRFDLLILDVGLPDLNGFEACRQLRQFSQVPVMFLTARGEEVDRVVGLEIGADDYVVKPFSPREVSARVRAILKRSAGGSRPPAAGSEFSIDTGRLVIQYRGHALRLTALEFRLLQQLLSLPEQVQSREQLLVAVGMAPEAGYERNIDTHIKSLRAKLREVHPAGDPIQTHRGFGYSYQPSAAKGPA